MTQRRLRKTPLPNNPPINLIGLLLAAPCANVRKEIILIGSGLNPKKGNKINSTHITISIKIKINLFLFFKYSLKS